MKTILLFLVWFSSSRLVGSVLGRNASLIHISANNSAKISIPNISVNVPAEWWEEMEEEGVADKVIVLGQ